MNRGSVWDAKRTLHRTEENGNSLTRKGGRLGEKSSNNWARRILVLDPLNLAKPHFPHL